MSRLAKTHAVLKINEIIKEYFIFFDFEVLEDYYSFTYSVYNEKPKTIENPTKQQLKNIINNKVLVGYNCNHYDAFILYAILFSSKSTALNLRKLSDNIIFNGNKYIGSFINKNPHFRTWFNGMDNDIKVRFVDLIEGDNKYSLKNLDLYFNGFCQKIDFSYYTSIKKIKEEDMLLTWKEYELHDVDLLSQFFREKEYKTFGVSYYNLLTLFSDYIQDFNKNTGYSNTNIHYLSNVVNKTVEHLFFTKIPNKKVDTFKLDEYVANLTNSNNLLIEKLKKLQPNLIYQEDDKNNGGINYVKLGIHKGNIYDIDITSMYPNIMLMNKNKLTNFNADKFNELLQERIFLKHNSPSDYKIQAYKIALNSTFGLLMFKDENKELAINLITKTGQNQILKLAIKLIEIFNCEIIQVATDGIMARYKDSTNDYHLLMKAREISSLPIDEVTSYDRVYIVRKNNYVAIKDADNNSPLVYKGKGLFKEKKGLNTILPKGYNRYYPNWLLSKMFNIELPKVKYITNGIKGCIYGYCGDFNYKINKDKKSHCNGEFLNDKIFQGKQYATKVSKNCVPVSIMSEYLYNESFLQIDEELQNLIDNGFINNIVRVKINNDNYEILDKGNSSIVKEKIKHLINQEDSKLMLKPDNNLMVLKNNNKVILIDKCKFIWKNSNRKTRDKILLEKFNSYFNDDLQMYYGVTKDCFIDLKNLPKNIIKLKDLLDKLAINV